MIERTLVILKPDAIEQRLNHAIFDEIRALGGLTLEEFRPYLRLPDDFVRTHYALYADREFFPRILAYMTRGPCSISVWQGENAVAKVRALAGATRPDEADPASLRARYGRITPDGGIENVIHCSATPADAAVEIAIFYSFRG